MSEKMLIVFILSIFVLGCTSPPSNTSVEKPLEPIPLKLGRLGFTVYDVGETSDPVLGGMMLLSMDLAVNASEVERQLDEGFRAMHLKNNSKDFYLIELSLGEQVFFFGTKGMDLSSYVSGEINQSDWGGRNKKTMEEFYARIEPLLDTEDFQAFPF